jgi:hypothetical protein
MKLNAFGKAVNEAPVKRVPVLSIGHCIDGFRPHRTSGAATGIVAPPR